MKRTITYFFTIALTLGIVTAASAQESKLHFEKFDGLASRARDVVEVNIDGKLLDLAKRVTVKVNDEKARKVALAISELKGIYVRVYNFENENEYNMADVDQVRAQLSGPGWSKLANVRSKKNNQRVDVYTLFNGDKMDGVAVVISESKSIALVNVVGMIDLEMLMELSGKLNIPKIDIERDSTVKPK